MYNRPVTVHFVRRHSFLDGQSTFCDRPLFATIYLRNRPLFATVHFPRPSNCATVNFSRPSTFRNCPLLDEKYILTRLFKLIAVPI